VATASLKERNWTVTSSIPYVKDLIEKSLNTDDMIDFDDVAEFKLMRDAQCNFNLTITNNWYLLTTLIDAVTGNTRGLPLLVNNRVYLFKKTKHCPLQCGIRVYNGQNKLLLEVARGNWYNDSRKA